VLRIEPRNKFGFYKRPRGDKSPRDPKPVDQADSAILELVDGPKDVRFAITARAVARQREKGLQTPNQLTMLNVGKVTRFRKDGVEELEEAIKELNLKKEQGRGKESEVD